jgi:cytochrome c
MSKRRTIFIVGLGFCSAIAIAGATSAQMTLPAAKPPDGAALFKQQCATCHATSLSEPPRQGPTLNKIVGRQAGKLEGFHYSPELAHANFTWDESRLDAWLTDPQAIIPGAVMPYRQANAETRSLIIDYLKGLN